MIPRIKLIEVRPDFMLYVVFDDGKTVLYDVKEDIATLPGYRTLQTTCNLFSQAQLDSSRTCVYWNADVDLQSDIIYEYGQAV